VVSTTRLKEKEEEEEEGVERAALSWSTSGGT